MLCSDWSNRQKEEKKRDEEENCHPVIMSPLNEGAVIKTDYMV
jgi:hypothetical protein